MKCQQAAGILDANEKLTEKAKRKFIDEVIAEMMFGSPSINLCGDSLLPVPFAELVDLYDEQLYPDWHATWPPRYEAIAKALNVEGGTPLAPFMDLTLALQFFKPDIDFQLPSLDLKLLTPDLLLPHLPDMKLPDIAIKFPELKTPTVELPKIPPFELPTFNFDLNFIGLGFFYKMLLELPTIVLDLAVPPKIDIALKIPNLPSFFAEICKLVKQKALPTNPNTKGLDLSYIAATSVLARKSTECVAIAVAACLIGSSPVGIVGLIGVDRGYKTKKDETPQEVTTETDREKIIAAAEVGVGLHSSRSKYHDEIRRQYANYLFPDYADQQGDWHLVQVEQPSFSSCGVYMRAVYRLAAGGTIHNTNVDAPYRTRVGNVINDLVQMAKIRNAIKYSPDMIHKTNLMNLDIKEGDGILISVPNANAKSYDFDNLKTHVLIVGEDLGTTKETKSIPKRNRIFTSYEGGAPNVVAGKKDGKDENGIFLKEGQRIKKGTYTFKQLGDGQKIIVSPSDRVVYYIFDGEKMLTPNGDG